MSGCIACIQGSRQAEKILYPISKEKEKEKEKKEKKKKKESLLKSQSRFAAAVRC